MAEYVSAGYWVTGYAEGDVGTLTPSPVHISWHAASPQIAAGGIITVEPATAKTRWHVAQPTARQLLFVVRPSPASWSFLPAIPTLSGQFVTRAQFFTAAALFQKDQEFVAADWLVEVEEIGMHLSYDFHPDDTWEHRILDLSEVELSVTPGGGLARVNNLTVRVIQDGQGQSPLSLWEQFFRLEGTTITLKLLFANEAYEDAILIFSGSIDQVLFHDGTAEILASDFSLTRDILLPEQLVDSMNFPRASQDAIGRTLPLVYGRGFRVSYAPMLLVDADNLIYRPAYHAMFQFPEEYAVFVPGANVALAVSGQASVFPAVFAGTELSLDQEPGKIRFGLSAGSLRINNETGVSNALNALDGVSSTIATFATSVNSIATATLGVIASFTANQQAALAQNTLEIELINHGRGAGSAPTTAAQVTVRVRDNNVVVNEALAMSPRFRSMTKQSSVIAFQNVALLSGQELEVLFQAINELPSLASAGDTYELGDMTVNLAFQAQGKETPIFLAGLWQGRTDPTGEIIGTSNFPVRTLTDVIRQIFLQDLDIAVDHAAFNLARTARLNWECDGGIGAGWAQEQMQSRDLVDTLARDSACYVYPSWEAQFTIRAYDINTPTEFDFDANTILYEDSGTDSDPDTRSSSMRVRLGTLEEVHNEYELRYAYNPVTAKYDKVRFVRPTGTNVAASLDITPSDLVTLCLNSLDRYGKRTPLIVESPFIYNDSTADLYINHLVQYFHTQRIYCVFNTFFNAAHLQIGSMVTINHPHIPTQDRGEAFETHSLRYSPNEGIIAIGASRLASTLFAQYWRMLDQDDVEWFYYFNQAGEMVRSSDAPDVSGLVFVDITVESGGDAPSWFQVTDETAFTGWYVYPDVDGALILNTAPPGSGFGEVVGLGKAARSARVSFVYRIAVRSWRELVTEEVGD